MSYGVGCRPSLDLALPWLWHRPAAAAPIWPLAWEISYASGIALGEKKKATEEKMFNVEDSQKRFNMCTTGAPEKENYTSGTNTVA